MVSRPRTYAINEAIGTVSDGVPVVALGVDVWMNRVVLSLRAVENDISDALLEVHQAEFTDSAGHREIRIGLDT